jgi:hypothetical protein
LGQAIFQAVLHGSDSVNQVISVQTNKMEAPKTFFGKFFLEGDDRMKSKFFFVFAVLVLLLAIGFTWALAESDPVSITPSSYDFGEVEVGTKSMVIFTLSSTDSDLVFGGAELFGSYDFQTTAMPGIGTPVTDAGVEVEVTYTPSGAGVDNGQMLVVVLDGMNYYLVENLTGVGVVVGQDPLAEIEEMLTFFDDSVADGTLIGSGAGKSADNRRNALRNMIEAVSDLIQNGDKETACQQLWDAYEKTDGIVPPPDFVQGEAAQELAQMIMDLYQAECSP